MDTRHRVAVMPVLLLYVRGLLEAYTMATIANSSQLVHLVQAMATHQPPTLPATLGDILRSELVVKVLVLPLTLTTAATTSGLLEGAAEMLGKVGRQLATSELVKELLKLPLIKRESISIGDKLELLMIISKDLVTSELVKEVLLLPITITRAALTSDTTRNIMHLGIAMAKDALVGLIGWDCVKLQMLQNLG